MVRPPMRNFVESRKRYLSDPLPIRLGNLASNLARIADFSESLEGDDGVVDLLEESISFVEWTIGDASPEVRKDLQTVQGRLTLWQNRLVIFLRDTSERLTMIHEALQWSERLLADSGILSDG